MIKKILKYTAIGFTLFIVLIALLITWSLYKSPEWAEDAHKKNLIDLETHMAFFNSIKHPESTAEIYYKSFFGNTTGASNHCEHVIIQMRKYDPGKENEIVDYYRKNYKGVDISFVKTSYDCCGNDDYGYRPICYGHFVDDQPKWTYLTANDLTPVYIVEYWVEGSYLSDWECN